MQGPPEERPPVARCRSNGFPTVRAATTSTLPAATESDSLRNSSSSSYDRDEQVGDARRPDIAEGGELFAIRTFEQQNAATDRLARVHGVQRPRRGDAVRMDHDFEVTRLHVLHARLEHDTTA